MLAKLNRPVRSPVNVPGPLGESYRFSPHPLPTVALGNVRRHYTLPALEWTTLVNRQTIEHLGLPLRETLRDGALVALLHATCYRFKGLRTVAFFACPSWLSAIYINRHSTLPFLLKGDYIRGSKDWCKFPPHIYFLKEPVIINACINRYLHPHSCRTEASRVGSSTCKSHQTMVRPSAQLSI